ncbi:MAG: sigma-54 dependent transcriptional regulator [Thermodesulfobacteriota bacterium]
MAATAPKRGIIYILDDEIITVRRLVQSLVRDGYDAEGFTTAAETVARLAERPADVLISDIRLQDGDGIDLLPRLRSLAPAMAVILITGYASVDQAVSAMKTGAFHYLAKPFRLEELRHAVREALRRQSAAGPGAQRPADPAHLPDRFGDIIGASPPMQEVFATIRQVAPLNCNVLLQGESGTGKELVARALHQFSDRRTHPFIPFNCGAFSDDLVANELFGHEKGAFTGAVSTKLGLLEAANGGTVFLDEVGEMPLPMQIKLLRVIQERTLLRVGGIQPVKIDVRLIAATNRDMEKMIAQGEFRQDLYYRLKVVAIDLPPLRERPGDLPLLARHFVGQAARQFGKAVPVIAASFLDGLSAYPFPGNVRELQNIIERAVALTREPELTGASLPADILLATIPPRPAEKTDTQLKSLERDHIAEVYRQCAFNQTETAKRLGISRTTLWRRLKEFDLAP